MKPARNDSDETETKEQSPEVRPVQVELRQMLHGRRQQDNDGNKRTDAEKRRSSRRLNNKIAMQALHLATENEPMSVA